MIVVADSSPLIVLANIQLVDVLPQLFGSVIIPPDVLHELQSSGRPPDSSDYFAKMPSWLKIVSPKSMALFHDLDAGEAAALNLAMELHADLVLVDERKAFKAALAHHLPAVGTIRVLERAAESGLIDLADAFDKMKRTDFWISHVLLDERLKLFRASRGNK